MDSTDAGEIHADPGNLFAYARANTKMRESRDISKIVPALVDLQGSIESPPRNKKVQVRTQQGSFEFRYATLDKIIDVLRPEMLRLRLCVLQPIVSDERGRPLLLTRILHDSGQFMEAEVALPSGPGSNPKDFGGVVTYLRRYTLTALLNISADEDDDASRAAGHHIREMPQRAIGARDVPARERGSRDGEPTEIAELAGEAVARALVNRARLAEGVDEGHALLEAWLQRSAVLEQLRGTRAWESLERELGAGLKRSLGVEPAAAFVTALRATEPAHVAALNAHMEGKWAKTLAAMTQEAPATYSLLKRHVTAQIARVRAAHPEPGQDKDGGPQDPPAAAEGNAQDA